jgi:hypothetical protein
MDNYRFYFPVRVQWFKSSKQASYHVHSLGASFDPKGGDLDTVPLDMVIMRMMSSMFFSRPTV